MKATAHPTIPPTPVPTASTPPQDSAAPQLRLLTPSSNTPSQYWVDGVIYLLAQARDATDGDISASIHWDFSMHHISLKHPENEHVHPLGRRFGQLVTMTMPTPDDVDAAALSFVEVRLSATNSQGKTSTLTHPILPQRVPLTLLTSPAGLRIKINGEPFVGPDIITAWAGQHLSISVDPIQIARDPILARVSAIVPITVTLPDTPALSDTQSITYDGPLDPEAQHWLTGQGERFVNAAVQVFLPMAIRGESGAIRIPQADIGKQYRFVRWMNGASPTHTLWVLPFDQYTQLRAEFASVDGTPASTATMVLPQPTTSPVKTATPAATTTAPPSTQGGVPTTRLARLARAANVTRWFNNPASNSDGHYRNYLGTADIQLLRELKLSALRLVVNPELFFDPSKPTTFSSKMHYLDDAVDWLIANKIAVVIELHDKGHMGNWEKDSWYVDQIMTFWKSLAERYADRDPEYLFFEIINEQRFLNDAARWSAIQTRWVRLMRMAVPKHTLIGSGNEWSLPGGLIAHAAVPNESNMIYDVHLYEPLEFTHQGASWMGDRLAGIHKLPYPADIPSCMDSANALNNAASRESARQYCQSGWGTAKLETRIRAIADWSRKTNLPVWIGEFGVYCDYTDADSRARWLRDARTLAEKYGIGWAIWGYDNCFGLDRKWRDGQLVVDETAKAAIGP